MFLDNDILRIFQYSPNWENFTEDKYIIDREQPLTIVEINDYQIDENGKINLIKTHPTLYLREFVTFYRSFQKDSDDPMNAYDF